MRRGTLGWFRYRMVSGVIFAVLGLVIAGEIATRPGGWQSKIAGLAFAAVAIGLGAIRVVQYLQARATMGTGPR